jgi:C4-dicarboxylate-specific signal transduction histidine kinase
MRLGPQIRMQEHKTARMPQEQQSSARGALLADRVQMQQVMINLAINAIEAIEAVTDRPRELVIRSCQDETDQVSIAVQDSSVGIAAENADRCSTPSSPANPMEWAWDYRSAVRSSKRTEDACGLSRT